MSNILEACELVFYNNMILPASQASLPIDSHMLHYGSAAFESLRVYRSGQGAVIIGLEQHLQRLAISMQGLKLKAIQSELIQSAILELIRVNKIEEGYVRVLAYPDGDCRSFDHSHYSSQFLITAWRVNAPRFSPPISLGVAVIHRPPALCWMSRAKLSGYYASDVAAHVEARKHGYDDALLLNMDGSVCEVTGAHIFLVKDGRILTPHILNTINGITRNIVIEIINILSLPFCEAAIPLEDFNAADEVFITGTFHGIKSIAQIGTEHISDGEPGPITRQIQDAYNDLIEQKSKLSAGWTAIINTFTSKNCKDDRQKTMLPVHIRKAQKKDIPQIKKAVESLINELAQKNDTTLRPEAVALCERFITDEAGGVIFVACPDESSEHIIGVITVSFQEALRTNGVYALIQELWVASGDRSKRVGEWLISAVENFCKAKKIKRIEVCLPGFQFPDFSKTLKFYNRCGFLLMGPRMKKEVH